MEFVSVRNSILVFFLFTVGYVGYMFRDLPGRWATCGSVKTVGTQEEQQDARYQTLCGAGLKREVACEEKTYVEEEFDDKTLVALNATQGLGMVINPDLVREKLFGTVCGVRE